jgi:hypothetical protein
MSQRPGRLGGRQERETLLFVAFWRGLQDAFWIEGWVNEVFSLTHYGWEPAKGSSDGTYQGLSTPSFSYPLSMRATSSATLGDRDR